MTHFTLHLVNSSIVNMRVLIREVMSEHECYLGITKKNTQQSLAAEGHAKNFTCVFVAGAIFRNQMEHTRIRKPCEVCVTGY